MTTEAIDEAVSKEFSLMIDGELEDFLPPVDKLTDEELKERLREWGGARDAILVWKETGLIYDGHRRYKFCKELNLPYKVLEKSFSTKEEVFAEMLAEQCARRNASDHHMAMWQSRRLKRLQSTGMSSREAVAKVAQETKTSPSTVYRHRDYGDKFDKLNAEEQAIVKALNLPKERVTKLASLSPVDRSVAFKVIKTEGLREYDRLLRDSADTRREVITKAAETHQEMPLPPVLPPDPDDIVGLSKKHRHEKLFNSAVEAYKNMRYANLHLLGPKGLGDAQNSPRNVKLKKAYRMISEVLDDISNS